MEYLTVKETAELKGCSERYIKTLCKDGKIQTEQELNCKGRMKYIIPVAALPEELQAKYYCQKRTESGLLPEKSDDEKTPFKYRSKGIKKAFEEFSEAERTENKILDGTSYAVAV